MTTLSEFRSQYPQYDDIPDAQLATSLYDKFYADMPRDQFDQMIGVAVSTPSQPNIVRGAILPFERNLDTGELSFAVPEIGSAILEAVTLPGDVVSGETPLRDATGELNPEVIERSFDLAGVAAPTGAAARGAVGAAARTATRQAPLTEGQQVAVSAQRLGVDLPRAVTAESRVAQQLGQQIGNVPGAGGPLRTAAEQAIEQLDDAAFRIQDSLGAGNRSAAGTAAREDLVSFITEDMARNVTRNYDAVDDVVDLGILRPLSSTKKTLDAIAAQRSGAGITGEGQAASVVRDAVNRPGGLNYEGVKNLRTYVGELLDNPSVLPSGTSQKELRRVYQALTNDLRGTVAKAGGEEGLARFNAANKYAARIARERESLNKILGRDGTSAEGIYENIVSLAGGTNKGANIDRLRLARRATSPETWNEIASASLARMGRDAEGNFTPQRFLTAYGKMSKEGRRALFGAQMTASLDDIARVSSRFKELNQYANPSGTAQNLSPYIFTAGVIADPFSTLTALAGGYGTAKLLARPQNARQVQQWADAQYRVLTNPTQASLRVLENRTQALSLTLAREAGALSLAPQFAARLNGIAEDDVQSNNGDDTQVNSPDQGQPRQYDPRFGL